MKSKMPVHVKKYKRFKNGKWEDVTDHYRMYSTVQLSEELLKDVRQGKAIILELGEVKYQLPEYLDNIEEFSEFWESLSIEDRILMISYLTDIEDSEVLRQLSLMSPDEFIENMHYEFDYSSDNQLLMIDVNDWLELKNMKRKKFI